MHLPTPTEASPPDHTVAASTQFDPPTRYAWIVFGLTFALMMSDYMSRQVMNAVFPFIKAEWALSDTQLGSLVSVVSLTVGVMIIPISLIVDRVGRVKSITTMAVLWGLATIACGLTGNFVTLLIARAFVGLGEAGYASAGGAILLQVFPTRMHSMVLGTFLSASLFGSVLGVVLGGSLAQHMSWHAAFILVGGGGLVLALIYPLLVKEPPARSAKETPRLPLKQVAHALFGCRTAIGAYLGLAANAFVQAALIAWAPSYLNRYHGMDPSMAATYAGLLVLLAGIGMIGGGYLVDRFSRQDRRNRMRLPALFVFCSGLILLVAFQLPPGVPQFILMGAGLMVSSFIIGSSGAVVTEVVPATIHATALATVSLSMNVLGNAPGPIVTGWIADQSTLLSALQFLPLLCLVSAVAFAFGANFYETDRQRLHG